MTPPEPDRSETGRHRTRLLQRRELSPGTVEVDLEKPDGFSFIPGQRIRLYDGGLWRDYSLVNAPDADVLTLCVRLVNGGAFSEILGTRPLNAPLALSGPHGYFVYHPSGRPAVWAATGTGIAPFAAMARAGASGTAVIHGVRNEDQLYYADLLRRVAGSYTACISGAMGDNAGHFAGRVTAYLRKRLPPGAYDFYLCGRREMIREATFIVDEQFPGSIVYTEIFY